MEKLPVPENICLRTEYWRGFGRSEAVKSAAVSGVAFAILAAFCMIHHGENDIVILVVGSVFAIAFCVGFFGKIPNSNQSIYEFLYKQATYRKEQQSFPYRKREERYYIAQEDKEDQF